ncbi:DMT family transporter [Sulfuricystis multivorans]|uniref:DMT family transporter n=1 Tax=Sulfuricystis multivorans TaxID=2211108 RepID=UPI000F849788|nr:DMT family transporter [Sulfuricystis multivorans]
MTVASLLRLLLLSAIWGGSFIFMRIAVPALGPAALMEFRVLLAAAFLAGVAHLSRTTLAAGEHWRHYLILGLVNSALPFLLFGYAALRLPAALMAILNATAPIWSTLIGVILLRHRLTPKGTLGLGFGMTGVALLVGLDPAMLVPGAGLAMMAALAAALCYGIASLYAKQARGIEPLANAHGSMWAAALWLLPPTFFFPPPVLPGSDVLLAVLVLGVVCSGIAYLLYFRLIAEIGAASALTVTFLIPLFGVLWGWLFLAETIGWHTWAGAGLVIAGTALVTGFSPRFLFFRPPARQAP